MSGILTALAGVTCHTDPVSSACMVFGMQLEAIEAAIEVDPQSKVDKRQLYALRQIVQGMGDKTPAGREMAATASRLLAEALLG